MDNIIKKTIIITIAVLAINFAAGAQVKGDKAAGANVVLTSSGEVDLLGVGAKFRYNTSKLFRLESSFNYLLEKDFVRRWDFFVNAHLLISLADRIKIYPLAGFGILEKTANYPVVTEINEWGEFTYGGKDSSNIAGCNLGVGIDYGITNKLVFNAELSGKYEAKINDARGNTYIMAGLVFRF